MARQEINLGTAPTGLGGDPPRTASQKINFMTKELYDRTEGMGTAAKRDVQTSNVDATAGLLMPVGAFGLGLTTTPRLPADNANAFLASGKYFTPATWTGSVFPATQSNNQGYLEVHPWSASNYVRQQWTSIGAAAGLRGTFERFCIFGNWGNWSRIYTEDTVAGTIALGGIIESGSTVNGEFTKLIDGTLICRLPIKQTAYVTVNVLRYPWSFPSLFLAGTVPNISITIHGIIGINRQISGAVPIGPSNTGITLDIYSKAQFVAGDEVNAQVSAIAMGRWKA